MSNITKEAVMDLREKTGAGLIDCKRALAETNGDMEEAISILRKKGVASAAKKAGREAGEGIISNAVSSDRKKGILVEVNCETDFVAKNEDFIGVAKTLLDLALAEGCENKDAILGLNFPGSDITVADKIVEETGKIGERIEIGDLQTATGDSVAAYIHPGNRLATVVGFTGDVNEGVGRDVAMQAAAMAPVAVDEANIPADLIEKEKAIGKDLAIQEGKPAELAEKIAMGRLNKWYKEVTLVNQPFIKDNKQTVSQYVAAECPGAAVSSFRRVALG